MTDENEGFMERDSIAGPYPSHAHAGYVRPESGSRALGQLCRACYKRHEAGGQLEFLPGVKGLLMQLARSTDHRSEWKHPASDRCGGCHGYAWADDWGYTGSWLT